MIKVNTIELSNHQEKIIGSYVGGKLQFSSRAAIELLFMVGKILKSSNGECFKLELDVTKNTHGDELFLFTKVNI